VTTGVIMPPDLIVRIGGELPACRYVKLEEPPTPTKITALGRLPGSDRLRIFGGMNGMYFFEELSRGAIGVMTGVAVPDILVKIYDLFVAGNVAGAAEMYDRYASYIRYEYKVRGPGGGGHRAAQGGPTPARRHPVELRPAAGSGPR
jgi:4-hydroxy-tetrahydrodipicolinate synthase